MVVAIRRLQVLTSLHLHLFGEIFFFFGQKPVVVVAKVASLFPELGHLGIFSFGYSPDPLTLSLMSFAILFDALFNLTLI